MLNASTIEQLRAMKFSAMAAAFEQQLKEPKSYSQLGFEERFGLMVDAEWNRRQDNKLHRRVRDARLDIPSASMEGIEYIPDRGLDKQQLLRLATCAYIEEGHHVILKGASGSGKTYLACALGYAACTRFKKVRYVRMPELLYASQGKRIEYNDPGDSDYIPELLALLKNSVFNNEILIVDARVRFDIVIYSGLADDGLPKYELKIGNKKKIEDKIALAQSIAKDKLDGNFKGEISVGADGDDNVKSAYARART